MTESRKCSECGKDLNRYSPGDLCGSCAWEARARTGQPPALPERFWTEPAMRDALKRRDLHTVLRIYRAATGLTQEAVALLIDSSQGNVSLIHRGRRKRYTIDEVESFRDGLRIPGQLLGLLPGLYEDGAVLLSDTKRDIGKVVPEEDAWAIPRANVLISEPSHARDDDMERRALLNLLMVTGSGAAIPAEHLETLLSGFGRALDVRDSFTVDDWEETVNDHAYALRVMPPAALVGVLSVDVADIRRTLDNRADLDRADMHRVSAKLAALMAMALEELDNPLASRWWRTAHAAAASAGDRHLEVYTRARQARATTTRPGALQKAQRAIELAQGRPSAGLAEAQATRAVILARKGDRTGAQKALGDLDELYGRLPADVTGDEAAIWGWPQQRYIGERTNVRLNLGDPSLYDELPKRPTSTSGARNQVIGELKTAWACINAGGVNDGVSDAAQALAVLPLDHRTSTMKTLVGSVCKALPDEQARSLPAARELRALTAGI
ncbi:helix-turn-helix domain-containing protein [Actinomadura graeca]|uniref:Helix-turn-helix domain-containing protein n=1 Tax=Actinomadura graeca TaxID=2750812 RepID=A0ABX8R070_9ACTN|nr:helix-turn-helix transcriptional regulator [Actinomadura graeca]QXJ24258.1 helix-turn-helix domain-containing protein [Actinomadura graeca]